MKNIVNIRFDKVNKENGCSCDRCGQWITNIYSVSYNDGTTVHFGIECFGKLNKENGLNKFQTKAINSLLNRLQHWTDIKEKYITKEINENNDDSWKYDQADWNKQSYWHGRKYEEYYKWMIEEFIPARFADIQKEFNKIFKK